METCSECSQQYDFEKAGFRYMCVPCQISRAHHPQVITKFGFPVDRELKELVEILNDLHISTSNSCQDQGPELDNVTWIMFATYEDTELLLLLMKQNDRSLYEYFQTSGKWSMCLDDESDDEDVYPSFSVRFPSEHLAAITQQFAQMKTVCSVGAQKATSSS